MTARRYSRRRFLALAGTAAAAPFLNLGRFQVFADSPDGPCSPDSFEILSRPRDRDKESA